MTVIDNLQYALRPLARTLRIYQWVKTGTLHQQSPDWLFNHWWAAVTQ